MIVLINEERDDINLEGDVDVIRLVDRLPRVVKAAVAINGTEDEVDVVLTLDEDIVVKIDKRVAVAYFTIEDSIDMSTDNMDEERKSDNTVIAMVKDVLNTLNVEAEDTVDVINTVDWVGINIAGKVPMAFLVAFAIKAPI